MSEVIVFGCDDLWNHIKSFLFDSCECWAKDYLLRLGPCEGKVSMVYVQKNECVYSKENIKQNIDLPNVYTHVTTIK